MASSAAVDSAVKDLDQLYVQGKTARVWLEPEWILNLAYFNNNQWLAWNGRQLFQPNLRPGRITFVDNRVTGCVRTEIAKMTKNRPVFVVVPSTADDEDVQAADLGERVMRYLWDHLNAGHVVMKALEWSRICGAGFVKTFWDSTVGDSTEVLVSSSTNRVLQDGQGAPMYARQHDPAMLAATLGLPAEEIRVKRIAQGDIRMEARSPFQMVVDPICDVFEEAEWVIDESVKSKEYVLRRFGVELSPDTPANPGLVEMKVGSFIPGSSPYKGVKLREYWAKPSSQFPNGRRVVWAQGKILEEDRNPFDALPYVMFSGVPIPGRLWPMSMVDLLRGVQTELNKVKSQIAENRNRLGNPTLIAQKQGIQDPDEFAESISTPGGIAWWDASYGPDAIPKYLEAPPLPEYVVNEIQLMLESIESISGQHEVSNAQVPPGVTAASAISMLQEADDTRLGPAITDYENQLSRLGQKILSLVANYYTDQRTVQIAGDNGAWQIFPFRGAMLKGNTHVKVQTGSAFPQSKAAKQAALMDVLRMLAQMGHQFDSKDLAEFLQDFDVGGVEKLIAQYTRDEAQVNRENLLLSQGKPLQINDYDDDEYHVTGHENFEKSSAFQNCPPEIQQLHLAHTAQHRQRLEQQQQQELQNQLALQGQVPPNLTVAAFQDQQQLAQLQGLQQLTQSSQDAQQQQQGQAQQQGFQQAQMEQQQRQAEQVHQTKLEQMQAEHHQKLQHAEASHQAQMARMQQQVEQQAQRARIQQQQARQQPNQRKAA